MKALLALLVVSLLLTAVTPVLAQATPPGLDTVRVWVNYGPGRGPEVRAALANAQAAFHYDFADLGAYVVTLPAAALDGIAHNPHVVAIEVDPERVPVEPVPEAAGPAAVAAGGDTVPYGIDMVQARDVWDTNDDGVIDEGAPTGAGRIVCIIDTGYQQSHPDLPDATGGYAQVDAPWTTDGYGHGSHVGGTVTAENNGYGVVGVMPGTADLFIVKIFNDRGKWVLFASDLAAALATCRSNGADVVSMSLSGGYSSNENQAFTSAYNAGVLNVAAAGNAGTSATAYPAGYASVVSVAAVDSLMNRANFSQYNADVELAAPGVGVLSTVPPDGYEAWSGTSMATPHVAAVAALIWSANPSWGVDQVRQALTATALDRGAVGRDVYYGYGIVQAAAALAYLGGGTPPPATPTPTAVPTATPLPTATPTPPGGELSVTVTTDRASYTNGKTVYITVTVTDQDSGAVSGAAVTVVITGANGSKVTLSGTTGTAGTVTVKWRVSTKKLGTGEYSVSATATKAGYTPGTGTTTFTVQ